MPPSIHFFKDRFFGFPSVNRESESTLGNKPIALDHLEFLTSPVVIGLVISTGHENPAGDFHPDLGGSKNMTSRVKGHLSLSNLALFAKGNALDPCLFS